MKRKSILKLNKIAQSLQGGIDRISHSTVLRSPKNGLLGLFIVLNILVLYPANASAYSIEKKDNPITSLINPQKKEKPKKNIKKASESSPKIHMINSGDTLTNIAAQYNIPLQRLWDKNTQLSDANTLNIGEKIAIPEPTEVLANRPLSIPSAISVATDRPVISENLYTPGNCTWYVKSLRPDLPNTLGDATSWYSRAEALGYAVGSTPKIGAVAWYYGHVALVTGVSDNMVTITEMNHLGLYIINERTVESSIFRYIY